VATVAAAADAVASVPMRVPAAAATVTDETRNDEYGGEQESTRAS